MANVTEETVVEAEASIAIDVQQDDASNLPEFNPTFEEDNQFNRVRQDAAEQREVPATPPEQAGQQTAASAELGSQPASADVSSSWQNLEGESRSRSSNLFSTPSDNAQQSTRGIAETLLGQAQRQQDQAHMPRMVRRDPLQV
jgi:hypothetical protein